jgi:hypothetical protein
MTAAVGMGRPSQIDVPTIIAAAARIVRVWFTTVYLESARISGGRDRNDNQRDLG